MRHVMHSTMIDIKFIYSVHLLVWETTADTLIHENTKHLDIDG